MYIGKLSFYDVNSKTFDLGFLFIEFLVYPLFSLEIVCFLD